MAIKIEMLRCFRAVLDQGSLADAAEVLGRTPSAVSMMLKQFEAHVGAPLFETGRKSRLTPLGAMIAEETRRELDHFERTIANIEGLARAEAGHVRIAATPSIAQSVLPGVLQRYLSRHPGVQLDLRDMNSRQVQRELDAGRADIGIASLPDMPGFQRRLLFSDPFGVVCRADHRLSRDWSRLTWKDLYGFNFISNGLCQFVDDPEFVPILNRAQLNVPNTGSLLALVRAGAGITLLPALAVPPGDAELVFLPLTDSAARREVWMSSRDDHLLTPAARAFAKALAETSVPEGAQAETLR